MKTAIALPITLAVTAATSSSSYSGSSKSSKSSNPLGLATGDVYNWLGGKYVAVNETFISLINGENLPIPNPAGSGTLTIERLDSASGLAFQSTYENAAIRLVSEGVASYNPKYSDEVELYCDMLSLMCHRAQCHQTGSLLRMHYSLITTTLGTHNYPSTRMESTS